MREGVRVGGTLDDVEAEGQDVPDRELDGCNCRLGPVHRRRVDAGAARLV
jgi:hypothetical protein